MEKKIVIIDDNEDYILSMRLFLERNNFKVLSATDGEKGIDLVKKEKPDLVLLDVMMETLFSGFEVGRKIKDDPELAHISVIGISGMHDEIHVKFDKYRDEEYFKPDDFFEKPVDKDELLLKINMLLGIKA